MCACAAITAHKAATRCRSRSPAKPPKTRCRASLTWASISAPSGRGDARKEKEKRKGKTISVKKTVKAIAIAAAIFAITSDAAAQKKYDLLLQGGRVIDPRNNINDV